LQWQDAGLDKESDDKLKHEDKVCSMFREYLKISFRDLWARKKRALLTMIGIFIGITAVVSLVSISQGLEQAINKEFELMGTDSIFIMPGSSFETTFTATSPLTNHDVELIKGVNGVDLAGGFVTKIAKIEYKDEIKYTWVIGFPQDESKKIIEDMQQFVISQGRDLKETDKYKVLIGSMIAGGDFFSDEVKINDRIFINDQKFEVIGSVEPIGNPSDDTQMYIPLETARELFNEPDNFITIMVKTKPGFDASDVAESIKKKMRNDRNLKKGEEDFTVQTSEQLREVAGVVLNLIQVVLIGIASISLLVGGIGIMNTMYSSVLERTKDIGIMKAIGGGNKDILLIFLIESGSLGLIGGLVGCMFGIGLAKLVEIFAAQSGYEILNASVSIELVAGSLMFSFIVGVLSGLLPAIKAARMRPVEALRYE